MGVYLGVEALTSTVCTLDPGELWYVESLAMTCNQFHFKLPAAQKLQPVAGVCSDVPLGNRPSRADARLLKAFAPWLGDIIHIDVADFPGLIDDWNDLPELQNPDVDTGPNGSILVGLFNPVQDAQDVSSCVLPRSECF